MASNEPGEGRSGGLLNADIFGDGNLRAAILGVNDGLVSNFSLVMGVAGGVDDPKWVLLAGIAGLLAGAFSMAAGEYVSVGGQRDVYRNRIRTLATSLRVSKDAEDSANSGHLRVEGPDALGIHDRGEASHGEPGSRAGHGDSGGTWAVRGHAGVSIRRGVQFVRGVRDWRDCAYTAPICSALGRWRSR